MGTEKETVVRPKRPLFGRASKTGDTIKVPLSWRVWLGHVILALAIFAAFYYTQATTVPSNPFHPFDTQETGAFGFLFGVLGSLVIN